MCLVFGSFCLVGSKGNFLTMSVRVSYVSSAPPPPHLEVEGIPDRPGNLPWPKSEPQSRPGRIPTTTGCSRLLDVFACFRVDKTLIPGLMTTHVARVKPTREPFATFRFCSLLPLVPVPTTHARQETWKCTGHSKDPLPDTCGSHVW